MGYGIGLVILPPWLHSPETLTLKRLAHYPYCYYWAIIREERPTTLEGVGGTTRLNILFLYCFNVCSRHCRTGRICHVYTLSTPYNRGLSEEVDRGTNVLLYGLEPQKVPPNTPNVIICSGFNSDIPLEKAHSMAEFGFLTGPQGEL